MVLSHSKRYVYSVIPKTGSTTLRHALKDYTDIGFPVLHHTHHVPLHLAQDTPYFSYYKEYFSFAFVRNPYDRIYSGYLQDIWASKNIEKWQIAKKELFESIEYNFSTYLQQYIANADLLNNWAYICYCPMWAFTEFDDFSVDFVGRLEDIDTDIDKLSELLSIDIVLGEKYNVRKKEPIDNYMEYYSKEDIACVNNLFKKDFQIFDYKMK